MITFISESKQETNYKKKKEKYSVVYLFQFKFLKEILVVFYVLLNMFYSF